MTAATIPSPMGPLTIEEEGGAIVRIRMGGDGARDRSAVLDAAAKQLARYFDGTLKQFDLPLALRGTPFQRKVWDTLSAIPYGTLKTYGDLARELGSVARAVGQACGTNPIPIVVPCHRVLAQGGGIGGFSGFHGTDSKRFLLALEGSGSGQFDLSICAGGAR